LSAVELHAKLRVRQSFRNFPFNFDYVLFSQGGEKLKN
jgi:hypothetical protein